MQINVPFDPIWLIVAAVVLVVVIVLIALLARSRRRKRALRYRQRYGSEYDRTVDEIGSRRAAEGELDERSARRESLDVTPLSEADRERFLVHWNEVQVQFAEAPDRAVERADALIGEVMRERGYDPSDDPRRRADDLALDHPRAVERYRMAHELLDTRRDSGVTTEDHRQALLNIRAMFDALVGTVAGDGSADAGEPTDAHRRDAGANEIRRSDVDPTRRDVDPTQRDVDPPRRDVDPPRRDDTTAGPDLHH